jgi:hypothetical protein
MMLKMAPLRSGFSFNRKKEGQTPDPLRNEDSHGHIFLPEIGGMAKNGVAYQIRFSQPTRTRGDSDGVGT